LRYWDNALEFTFKYTRTIIYVVLGLVVIRVKADTNNSTVDDNAGKSPASQEMDTSSGLDLGNIFKQCSLSRSAANTMNITEIREGSFHCIPNRVTAHWQSLLGGGSGRVADISWG
jgi:hypothetical protein